MKVNTSRGEIDIDIDDQKIFESVSEAICDALSELPDIIGAAIDKVFEIKEDDVLVHFWADDESGSPAVHVATRNGDEDDWCDKTISLEEIVKQALEKEDKEPMLHAAKKMRELADYIDATINNQKA